MKCFKIFLCRSFAIVALGLLLLALPPAARAGSVIYVKWNASGTNNGTSWANAYTSLQSALSAAASGDEIWVAQGTYYPTTGTDRTISFQLKNGVGIYGGFAGNETARNQRDFRNNMTTLSGNIGASGDSSDNSYHVVVSSANDATAWIDGFIVQDGFADGATYPQFVGAGMYVVNGNPRVNNMAIWANYAGNASGYGGGAGLYNDHSSPIESNLYFYANYAAGLLGKGGAGGGLFNWYSNGKIINAVFYNNHAATTGGGMANSSSNPGIVNVLFVGNVADYSGGGVYNRDSQPGKVNVTLVYNTAGGSGGGMINLQNSSPAVSNSIIWGNMAPTGSQIYNQDTSSVTVTYSDVQGGYSGTGNINSDPLFVRNPSPGSDGIWGTVDDDFGNVHLQPNSPAIDAGDNSAVPADTADLDNDGSTAEPAPVDLEGNRRFVDHFRSDSGNGTPPIVDMGALETPNTIYLPFISRSH